MDSENDRFLTDGTQYAYHLQSYDRWSPGDLEFHHQFRDGRWKVDPNRSVGDGEYEFDIPFPDAFGAVGDAAELKIPLELITNPISALVKGYVHVDSVGELSVSDIIGVTY